MEDFAIEVKNLSKIYNIYEKPIDRLKEVCSFSKKKYHREFYALKKVNFKVRKGEVLGILGKNGAGKSTLLKILTGVLSPSEGNVAVYGKISSLLELGAGFNPEFTGIENVYLNGTVMGFSKEEMDKKIDSILDFADIGDFANQPVKTYSSGMYVRLAFSVAINVDPDIFIIDEALAVGDVRFQQKCFAKIDELKKKKATIIFVSHDLTSIKKLCSIAILMQEGELLDIGIPKDVCIKYFDLVFPKKNALENLSGDSKNDEQYSVDSLIIEPQKEKINSFGYGGISITKMIFCGAPHNKLVGGEKISVTIKFKCDYDFVSSVIEKEQVLANFISGISISDAKGTYLFGMTTYDKKIFITPKKGGEYSVTYDFTFPFLQNGDYLLNTALALGTQEHHVQLKWYDGITILKMESCKKYVYGLFYNKYNVKLEENNEI